MESYIHIQQRESPIIATAIHDGHFILPVFREMMQLQEHERMREEDPYTAYMSAIPVNTVTIDTSRFLVDLNRAPERCFYKSPEDAWGLTVWKSALPDAMAQGLMDYYALFYERVDALIQEQIRTYGYFVVLDIHSYNHRRLNPFEEAPIAENPEINIGTIHNAPKWRGLIDQFTDFLSHTLIKRREPDVRENVKFKGGYLSQWICEHYGNEGCVLSVEFKKTFMDEWTGRADIDHLADIQQALKNSIPILTNELRKIST